MGTGLARLGSKWTTAVVVVAILALVQFASNFFPPYLFPDLQRIWHGLLEIVSGDKRSIGITLLRFVVAMILAGGIGWALAIVMAAFKSSVGRFLQPFFSIVQAIPALSWVLLSVLWIGDIETRIVFICFVISIPFFVVTVYEGIRDLDSDLVHAIEQFRPTRLQMIGILLIPQSLAYLLISFRSSAAFSLRILVFAEMIGATSGIGSSMGDAQSAFRLDLIFAWTIILVVLNFVLIALLDAAERHLLTWRTEAVLR